MSSPKRMNRLVIAAIPVVLLSLWGGRPAGAASDGPGIPPGADRIRDSRTLRVPEQYSTIGQAISVARHRDVIRVSPSGSPYRESLLIDGDRLRQLAIVGDGPGVVIEAANNDAPIIHVDNPQNRRLDVFLRDITLDGRGMAPYGVLVEPGQGEGALRPCPTHLSMFSVTVLGCNIGVQVGYRTGTFDCLGNWGAVDLAKLNQVPTWIEAVDCVMVQNGADGMNLYRASGRIEGCLVAGNRDEGIHTTHAHQMDIVHNIFLRNRSNNLHLQLGEDVLLHNNVVGMADSGSDLVGGLGVVIGGGVDWVRSVDVANNLFVGNRSTALRIQPCEVVSDSTQCVPLAAIVDVRSNMLVGNSWGEGPVMVYMTRDHPGMLLTAEYNLFDVRSNAANIPLDSTNVLGATPWFEFVPDPVKVRGIRTLEDARAVMAGFTLQPGSDGIDGGDPADRDGGGRARGTLRADQGTFGGPRSDW